MKIFISLLSALVLLKCGGPSTPNYKIATGMKANKAKWGDTLQLKIKNNTPEKVSYFLNNTPITPNHVLTNEPLGDQVLKAVINTGESTQEVETTLTLLADTPPLLYTYEILNTYPHDKTAYTQGLEFDEEILYESTGLNGKSSLRTVDYKTGAIIENKPLDEAYFGEGLTLLNEQIIQLTWKAQKGFVYNKASLAMKKSFPYEESKEGWGLCNDGHYLYKSDGTNRIWVLDPTTYEELKSIQVMTHKSPVKNINELEWVKGKIYANTYQFEKEVSVIIDPISGAVEGVIDFSGLKKQVEQHPQLNVLNGIAYHKTRNTFFVTGKNWSKLFEVSILPKK
jgi:glutamine cyclotransferase